MPIINLKETNALGDTEHLEFDTLQEFLQFLHKEGHLTEFGMIDEVTLQPNPLEDLQDSSASSRSESLDS